MPEPTPFADLIRRVRARDEAAAVELVRQYEPEIRRIARVRLASAGLRKLLDSTDICQSVLTHFFVRVAAGQFDLEDPRQLLKLLVTMACNKVRDQVRKQNAQRRGDGRRAAGPEGLEGVADPDAGPGRLVAAREIVEAVLGRLTADEREIVEERSAGRDWATLAAERGVGAEALRKRQARAIDRAARAAGIDEVSDV